MKKIILTTLLFLILINCLSYCFAFEIGEKQIIQIADHKNLLIYKGAAIGTAHMVYQENGINYPAYCLNLGLKGADRESYSVIGENKLQDNVAWKVIVNGYPYKSIEELGVENEGEAYVATKHAIDVALNENTIVEDFKPAESEAGQRTYQAFLNILKSAEQTNEGIINEIQVSIMPENDNWEIDNLNKTCISKIYNLTSNVKNGEYKIELQGNIPKDTVVVDLNNNQKNDFKIGDKFKILIPIENLLQSENFTIKAISNLETKPVVYGKTTVPNTQNYALAGFIYEEKENSFIEEYSKNISKITIIKKEEGTDKKLSGVKFNLLDENQNVLKENLITNENGEIVLEEMMPGKYFLQEIETLENYNLNTDLLEINLDFNQELEFVVTNSIKTIPKDNKTFESIEVESVKKLPVTGY